MAWEKNLCYNKSQLTPNRVSAAFDSGYGQGLDLEANPIKIL